MTCFGGWWGGGGGGGEERGVGRGGGVCGGGGEEPSRKVNACHGQGTNFNDAIFWDAARDIRVTSCVTAYSPLHFRASSTHLDLF